MKRPRITAPALCRVVAFLCFATGFVGFAAGDFLDDFDNDDPTNPLRDPVSWTEVFGGRLTVDNGDLILDGGNGLAGAAVYDFDAEDVAVETQFRILQGTTAGVAVRYQIDPGSCDFVDVSSTFLTARPLTCGSEAIGDRIPVDIDASEEDVVLRVEAVGDELSFWVWPADTVRPDAPLATVSASPDVTVGTVGIYVYGPDGGPVQAVFRYVKAVTLPESVFGDFSGDGVLDVADIDLLSDAVRSGGDDIAFDLNGDKVVDDDDRAVWVRDLKNTYFGDANLDGEFDSTDLVAVLASGEYEDGVAGNSGWATGDWDGDGDATTRDLVLTLADGGYEQGPLGDVNAVPEPTALLMLIAGMLGVAVCRRRSAD